MINVTINIQAPELAHALETLAIAIGCTVDKIGVGDAIKHAVQQKHPANENSWVAEAETAQTVQTVQTFTETQVDTEESRYALEEVRKALGDLAKTKG